MEIDGEKGTIPSVAGKMGRRFRADRVGERLGATPSPPRPDLAAVGRELVRFGFVEHEPKKS